MAARDCEELEDRIKALIQPREDNVERTVLDVARHLDAKFGNGDRPLEREISGRDPEEVMRVIQDVITERMMKGSS